VQLQVIQQRKALLELLHILAHWLIAPSGLSLGQGSLHSQARMVDGSVFLEPQGPELMQTSKQGSPTQPQAAMAEGLAGIKRSWARLCQTVRA
jgi:hypothetical protein